ncbi:MAG: Mo-dependent nitrogenase C-terminal domain-containing protein [Phormidesmis sp.]
MDYSLPRLTLPKVRRSLNILNSIKRKIEGIPVENETTAHRIVSLIPADCPFERDLKLFGRTIAHIPPMCKINPLYEPLIMLRFKALCYLVDECGEDAAALS